MENNDSRSPLLLMAYQRYLKDRDLVGFVQLISHRYAMTTLERLADQRSFELRRSAVFALGFVGDFSVHRTLGRALVDEDEQVARLAKTASRFVWNRSGTKLERQELATIIGLNASEKHRDAIECATRLIGWAPSFAEAWYQRGSARFQMGQWSEAVEDFNQALEFNAYQFVAATALGEAYLRLGRSSWALDAFQRALQLAPMLDGLQIRVDELSGRGPSD